ncbi:MAG: hypothetical protein JXN59_06105 [Anaerolineae bacterium]|nr:hypothetical protein [Anaerolineae bacterium]
MSDTLSRTAPPPALETCFCQHAPAAGEHERVFALGPGSSIWVAAAANGSPVMNLFLPELDARLAFRLSTPGEPPCRVDVLGLPLPPWALYIGAVGWAWAAEGQAVPGLDAVVLSSGGVREGFVWETGLSFAAAWQDLGGWPLPAGGLLGLMTRLRGFFH